jgi:hypothetical protein
MRKSVKEIKNRSLEISKEEQKRIENDEEFKKGLKKLGEFILKETAKQEPYCRYCEKHASEILEYRMFAAEEGISPEEYIKEQEGTYDEDSNTFVCTDCYIRRGM